MKFHKKSKIKRNDNKKDEEQEEIDNLKKKIAEFDWSKFERFDDIPISSKTKRGLIKNNYVVPTDIQKQSIGFALNGNDVLGAAKTGSGKTLAFLIPMLECLYHNRWTPFDGVGALIISPTRELSYQTFEVLKKIGAEHDFSAGLIIGGKDLKFESKRMDRCNIIVCTPGRLLQHMDENPLFNCDNLKILILDEADRILDLGFAKTMDAIVGNLPKHRQTLLFSATQTKSVKDLAKLSLRDPIYVSSHEKEKHATPDNLIQSYIVCQLEEKINLLWSFIKQHTKQKIIVFMSTCKQVKFIYELFCHLRPGVPLLALYGTLHQLKRMNIYDTFCESSRVVLFATDIAARGLDFPSVNWVVQLDCPEDTNTYIHRVGRTARFEKNGESLLVLVPSEEESMIKQLKNRRVPIEKILVNPNKIVSIQRKAEALLAKYVPLKESAQRAFKAYLKSIFLMTDKTVFNYQSLNIDKFAQSFGLLTTPRVRFIERKLANNNKNKTKAPDNSESRIPEKEKNDSEQERMPKISLESDDDDDDELFKVKNYEYEDDLTTTANKMNEISQKSRKTLTKAAITKRLLKKNIKLNTKIVFDEESNPKMDSFPNRQTSEHVKKLDQIESGIDIELAKQIMKDEDLIDKKLYREVIKEKRLNKKLKEKEKLKKSQSSDGEEEDEEEQQEQEKFEEEYSDEEPTDSGLTQEYINELPDPDKVFNDPEQKSYGMDDFEPSTTTSYQKFNSKRKLSSSLSSPSLKTEKLKQKKTMNERKDLKFYEQMAEKLLDI